jgi:G2/mitotic-specific cyclin-B, other
MTKQPEMNTKMRAILMDWIIEIHYKFELMPETLYLCMYIVDRYMSLQPVPRAELQLVGVAAILIASKYEEIWAPEVRPNSRLCSAGSCFGCFKLNYLILAGQRANTNS